MLVVKSSNVLELNSIPQVYLFTWSTNCKNIVGSLHPRNRCHYVTVIFGIKDLFNVSSLCIPEIYSLR